MSVAEAAAQYGTPVSDFCRLNPLVASADLILPGTQVFVYV